MDMFGDEGVESHNTIIDVISPAPNLVTSKSINLI